MEKENAAPFDQHFESLDMLADKMNEVLGCPVTIEDVNHRLIAYSSHDPQTDSARIATIVGRRVPEKVISGLWREGAIQKLIDSSEPVRVRAIEDIGLSNRVAIAIRKNADILGYIWVMEDDKALDRQQFVQIRQAAEAAKSKLVQLQLQRRKEEEGLRDFFWQLLMGRVHSEALIRDQAEKLGIVLPDSFQVLVLEFASEAEANRVHQVLDMIAAAQHFRVVFHSADQRQMILLYAPLPQHVSSQVAAKSVVDFIERLKARFGPAFVEGGSGSSYSEYGMVETSYREALAVLAIKRKFPAETGGVHDYFGLGYYRFLPAISEERRKRHFANPSLEKLRKYDREHNGNLEYTLEVFLCNDSNVKAVADILHVHANTLNYRLKRIAEIGEIDLADMDQKVTLYLELKAARYDKRA